MLRKFSFDRAVVQIILALRGAVGVERKTPGVACAPPGANLLPALRAGLLHAGGVRANLLPALRAGLLHAGGVRANLLPALRAGLLHAGVCELISCQPFGLASCTPEACEDGSPGCASDSEPPRVGDHTESAPR